MTDYDGLEQHMMSPLLRAAAMVAVKAVVRDAGDLHDDGSAADAERNIQLLENELGRVKAEGRTRQDRYEQLGILEDRELAERLAAAEADVRTAYRELRADALAALEEIWAEEVDVESAIEEWRRLLDDRRAAEATA